MVTRRITTQSLSTQTVTINFQSMTYHTKKESIGSIDVQSERGKMKVSNTEEWRSLFLYKAENTKIRKKETLERTERQWFERVSGFWSFDVKACRTENRVCIDFLSKQL